MQDDSEEPKLQALIEASQERQQTLEELQRKYNAVAVVAAMQTQRAETLEKQRDQLTEALNSALQLQDQMLNEIRHLNTQLGNQAVPPLQLIMAKKRFDEAMKALLSATGGD